MVKYKLVFFSILFFSCASKKQNEEKLLYIEDIRNSNSTLRMDGFYYKDSSSEFEKSIDVFLLFKEGILVNEGRYNSVSNNYCLIDTKKENTIENAINNYKSRLIQLKRFNDLPSSCKILENDLDGKGVYSIKNDSIILQFFKSDFKKKNKDSLNDYFLQEHQGVVLNDSIFKIFKVINYRDNNSIDVNFIYKFSKDSNKPILDSKEILNKIY
ncbi:hypothetical protein [Flavobacterium sp. UBA7663]|uniref:hypothetical protein n=1 Tax=Flavobacterium sp. UBA7663 TaxID=1946557 RepID=UPI0025C718F9|nr:hypothetical protein [Flavobacterium sp. UBA7663]